MSEYVTVMRNSIAFVLTISALGTVATAGIPLGPLTDAASPIGLEISTGTAGSRLLLRGADARRQLLVTAHFAGGAERDATRRLHYQVSPRGIVDVDDKGLVSAIGNGQAIIVARCGSGQTASISVSVEGVAQTAAINFPDQIVPIFTKLGCNGGGCHGKASGQNGFRLSLLGFEPSEDYEHLVNESRGRRLFPAAPDRSLLLLKATAAIPHGGGQRLEPGSDDYRLLVRWIGQGMPYGSASDPTVVRIEVWPQRRIMSPHGVQQLLVQAIYSDGTSQDVTRQALYEPNDHDMAGVDADGYVKMLGPVGDVGIMVRYQAKVAVFRGTVPLGAPIAELPPARNFIDELVFKKLTEMGMPPSPVCGDATFLRRVTIDIAGRLPTLEETRSFLADPASDKRDKLIDRLLASSDYAEYFANKWSALLRNKRTRPQSARATFAFHDWVRDSFMTNKPFDQLVREILTASGDSDINPAVAWYRQVRDPNAQLQDTAQLFLGMRLQCAQCHHHPFEKWSQQDYYEFAAFFARVARKDGGRDGDEIVFFRRGEASAVNTKTHQSVRPAPLGEKALYLSADQDPRQVLADWITRRDNPFFARALVNRYWKHFFGRGIVEPEDDLRDTNPPTNPALLDGLAKHLVDSGYDLKALVRTICRSSTYQLDAAPNRYNVVDRQNFSRYYPKRLTAETLLDATDELTGSPSRFALLPAGTPAVDLPDNSYNADSYFLTVFGRPDSSSSCECERSQQPSLAQSLHLLNAKEIQEKLTSAGGRAARLAADDSRAMNQKVAELYLLAYSRPPQATELSAANAYIQRKSHRADQKDRSAATRQAYEDLIWTLINTKEFSFNH